MASRMGVRLEHVITARLRHKKTLSIALAGGTTPGPVYTALSSRALPWSRIAVTLTDERWRHRREKGSNERMVRSTPLTRLHKAQSDRLIDDWRPLRPLTSAFLEWEPMVTSHLCFQTPTVWKQQ